LLDTDELVLFLEVEEGSYPEDDLNFIVFVLVSRGELLLFALHMNKYSNILKSWACTWFNKTMSDGLSKGWTE